METGLCFDMLDYNKANDIVYNKETGEIIEDIALIEEIIYEHEKQERYDKAKKEELKKKIGKVDKRITHNLNWKERSMFIKVYRTELREYMKVANLSPNAGLLLFSIQMYVEYETNRIATPEGNNFTNKDLQELTGLGRDSVEKVLNELENKHFIVRIGQGKARKIYFNPYLMCPGNEILKTTVKLFGDYVPCTPY